MGTSETVLTRKRYDRQARLYDLMETPWEVMVNSRLRKRLWAQVGEGALLEVGVGTGKNLPYHPQGARSVAVDLSPRMLSRAAGRAHRLGRHVGWRRQCFRRRTVAQLHNRRRSCRQHCVQHRRG